MANKNLTERKYDTLRETIRINVKSVRNRRGYTQEKLGEISGLGRIRIVEIEGGRYCPTIQTLNTLAIALGVEVYQLLTPSADEITLK